MIERLVHALIASRNEAADDVLLEALDLGNAVEKRVALGAILRRGRLRGLSGVVQRYDELPGDLKLSVLDHINVFGGALSECGRSPDHRRRLAAMKLIALGRRGRLGYVLLENLGAPDESLQRAAVEAMVAMSRWVASETRRVHAQGPRRDADVRELLSVRGEVEGVIFKALERQKGMFGEELTRAALLLADWGGSQTLAILRLTRHPGRIGMETRLIQPPASEQVEAWLLGASHGGAGGVRNAFAGTFAHVHERPVLDGILRQTHWLKDQKLAGCARHVVGGRWMDEVPLAKDLAKRPTADVGPIAEWVGASGCAEVTKDALLKKLADKSKDDVAARLRVLRILIARPHGASAHLLKHLLADPDERLRRIAAREIARRRPAGYQSTLMSAVAGAPPSVAAVIGRAAGDAGFHAFWRKYDRLDQSVRRSAGRAVVRIVPGVAKKLSAMLTTGPAAERVRALQLLTDTEMVDGLRNVVLRLCEDPDVRVRSKAVVTTAAIRPLPEASLVEWILTDQNARVRANAIEVLEHAREFRLAPVLAGRVRAENNRERANAIKALHAIAPAPAAAELAHMLQDRRPMHRLSALWALRQVRNWAQLGEVGRMARDDADPSVRRYALGVLKGAADEIRSAKGAAA